MPRAPAVERLFFDQVTTPTGEMLAIFDADARLRAFDWVDCDERMRRQLRLHYGEEGKGFRLVAQALPATMREALEAYFAGDLRAIDAIPVMAGGTAFQRAVWGALRQIPPGKTLSYAILAARLGQARAARAVGAANAVNPVAIVVPCHRLIGTDGSLAGYGGGIERKRWLLAHEGVAA